MTIVDRKELGIILDWSEGQILKFEKQGMPVHQRGSDGSAELYDTVKVIEWAVSLDVLRALLKKWRKSINPASPS